jgi:hypothetical protein
LLVACSDRSAILAFTSTLQGAEPVVSNASWRLAATSSQVSSEMGPVAPQKEKGEYDVSRPGLSTRTFWWWLMSKYRQQIPPLSLLSVIQGGFVHKAASKVFSLHQSSTIQMASCPCCPRYGGSWNVKRGDHGSASCCLHGKTREDCGTRG